MSSRNSEPYIGIFNETWEMRIQMINSQLMIHNSIQSNFTQPFTELKVGILLNVVSGAVKDILSQI